MAVIDSYSETNYADITLNIYNGSYTGASQSFTGDGNNLGSSKFYLKKFGSPTGNAVAKLYDHSGTFGTSSVPTGSALATSSTFDVSTLTTTAQLIEFSFDGTYTLVNGTKYVITIEYSGGSGANQVQVGFDVVLHRIMVI